MSKNERAVLFINERSYNLLSFIIKRKDLYVSMYVCHKLAKKVLDGFG